MALEFISKDIASSTPTTLKVTGIDTDAVHVVVFNDVVPSADERLGVRVTKGGTIQSDANYDNGRRGFTISGGFQSNADTGENEILCGQVLLHNFKMLEEEFIEYRVPVMGFRFSLTVEELLRMVAVWLYIS